MARAAVEKAHSVGLVIHQSSSEPCVRLALAVSVVEGAGSCMVFPAKGASLLLRPAACEVVRAA